MDLSVPNLSVTHITVPEFSDKEVPAGIIDGKNLVFTVVNAPNPPASLNLFLNGLLQMDSGTSYTLSGQTVTFVKPPVPGDVLICSYRF